MNKTAIVWCCVLLIAIAGPVSGADTASGSNGSITNVFFAKMIETGDSYAFQPLPTLYLGTGDYDKRIFISGSDNLEEGDYAILQKTSDGYHLVQTMKITPPENATYGYTLLELALREDQLYGPIEITGSSVTPASAAAVTTATGTEAPAPGTSGAAATAAAVPAATKSPVSPLAVIAGIGLAGIAYTIRLLR